jgi:hypothetical protein
MHGRMQEHVHAVADMLMSSGSAGMLLCWLGCISSALTPQRYSSHLCWDGQDLPLCESGSSTKQGQRGNIDHVSFKMLRHTNCMVAYRPPAGQASCSRVGYSSCAQEAAQLVLKGMNAPKPSCQAHPPRNAGRAPTAVSTEQAAACQVKRDAP